MERKKKMKKQLKAVISVLLALVLFASSIPVGAIDAFAAGKLSIDIDYDYYGTAFVTLTPGDPDNYVTYTTDGSMPDEDSAKYEKEIIVYSKMILRVAEYTPDGDRVKGLKTTVKAKLAPVTFEVDQLGGKAKVTMICATSGAEIRYTTDGSKPTQDSALYTEPLILTEKTKIRVRAYCEGLKTTTTYGKTVKIVSAEALKAAEDEKKDDEKKDSGKSNGWDPFASGTSSSDKSDSSTGGWGDPMASGNSDKSDEKEEKPAETVKPEEKEEEKEEDKSDEKDEDKAEDDDEDVKIYAAKAAYGGDLIDYRLVHVSDKAYTNIELVPQISTHKIVYTTDDSSPKENGKKYTKRFKIEKPTVIRAIEYNKAGEIVASLRVTAKVKCAPVTFECTEITDGMRVIRLSTLTEGATIYYTTNGKFPTTSSKVYDEELVVSPSTPLKAIAVKENYIKSNVSAEDAGTIALKLPEADMNDENILYLLGEINKRRAKSNLPALELNEGLCRAAAVRAIEIQSFDSFNRPSGGSHLNAAAEAGVFMAYSVEYRYRYFDGLYQIPDWIFKEKSLINDNSYSPDAIGIGYCIVDGVNTCIIIVGKIQK